MPLGSADEQKPAADGTVEAWARSADNPVGGWYGLKKGLRGRFANVRAARARSSSGWPRSSTTRATTACAPSDAGRYSPPGSSSPPDVDSPVGFEGPPDLRWVSRSTGIGTMTVEVRSDDISIRVWK